MKKMSKQASNARNVVTRGKEKPTVISLFAGAGGSSLGYRLAGFRELLAIEWDPHAAMTFTANFPGIPLLQKDISTIDPKQVLTMCDIEIRDLDVLDGSPPCQGFSMSGKRKVDDTRNKLFMSYIRFINGLKPKVFLMENVPGMVQGKMRGMFLEILKSLKKTGYKVKCKRMNSKYYGVPQSRERLIFIGIRPDIQKDISFPEPDPNIKTVFSALRGLKIDGEIRYPKGMLAKYYYHIKPGKSLADYMSKKTGKSSYFNAIKLNPNKPSNTVTKIFGEGISGLLHWKEKRFLTIKELKRISSFPDDFKFSGKFEDQWARIGNAVMPKFMESIAAHIKNTILV